MKRQNRKMVRRRGFRIRLSRFRTLDELHKLSEPGFPVVKKKKSPLQYITGLS